MSNKLKINDRFTDSQMCDVTTDGNNLPVALFMEVMPGNSTYSLFARKWDGANWNTIGAAIATGLNAGERQASVVYFNGVLWVSLLTGLGSLQTWAFDGQIWAQQGASNINSGGTAHGNQLVTDNHTLYLVWNSGGNCRVAKWNDITSVWSRIDASGLDHETGGILGNGIDAEMYNHTLYLSFIESFGGAKSLRTWSYNGSAWTALPQVAVDATFFTSEHATFTNSNITLTAVATGQTYTVNFVINGPSASLSHTNVGNAYTFHLASDGSSASTTTYATLAAYITANLSGVFKAFNLTSNIVLTSVGTFSLAFLPLTPNSTTAMSVDRRTGDVYVGVGLLGNSIGWDTGKQYYNSFVLKYNGSSWAIFGGVISGILQSTLHQDIAVLHDDFPLLIRGDGHGSDSDRLIAHEWTGSIWTQTILNYNQNLQSAFPRAARSPNGTVFVGFTEFAEIGVDWTESQVSGSFFYTPTEHYNKMVYVKQYTNTGTLLRPAESNEIVSGHGVPRATDQKQHLNVDASTVIGNAVISQLEAASYHDAASVVGAAVISSLESRIEVDSGTVISIGVINGIDTLISGGGTFTDAATVIGNAVLSATDQIVGVDLTRNAPVLAGTGVSLRYGSSGNEYLDTTVDYATAPDVKIRSIWVNWSTLHTALNTFTWPTLLDKSIEHAAANGYKIVFRVACGPSAPAWIKTDPANPVQWWTTLAISGNAVPVNWPIPFDVNLLDHYQALCDYLGTKLAGVTTAGSGNTGGVSRSANIYMVPISMPTEISTDMSVNYGASATYSPSPASQAPATLTAGITAAATSFGLSGTLTGYPTALSLWQIGSELILGTRSGTTVTVHSGGRGFSGTTAVAHNTADAVFYASSGTYVDTAGTFGSNIANAPYDRLAWNTSIWLGGGRTLASNRANIQQAWSDATDAVVQRVSNVAQVPASIAYGNLFSDRFAGAVTLADALASAYPGQLIGMTTNYQPMADASNNPTHTAINNTVYPTYYEAWNVFNASPLRTHVAAGGAVGVQLADKSVYDSFSNPYNRASGNPSLAAIEEIFTQYTGFQFIDMAQPMITQGKGGTNTSDNYYYFVDPANVTNVQSRLSRINYNSGAIVTGQAVISSIDNQNLAVGAQIGFETGDFSLFSSTLNPGNDISVSNIKSLYGLYSMLVNRITGGNIDYAQVNIPPGNRRVSTRLYVEVDNLPDAAVVLASLQQTQSMTIRLSPNGVIQVFVAGSSTVHQDIYTIPPGGINSGTWYRIEVIYDVSTVANNAFVRVYDSLGNILVNSGNAGWDAGSGSVLVSNTGVGADITQGRIGIVNTLPTTGKYWMDSYGLTWGGASPFVRTLDQQAPVGTGTIVTLTIPSGGVPIGHTIILGAGSNHVAVTSVTDSRGNTYTSNASVLPSTATAASLWSAPITTALLAGDTITVTYSGTVSGRSVVAAEYQYLVAPANDAGVTSTASSTVFTNTNASVSEPNPTSQANEIVVSFICIGGSGASAGAVSAGGSLTQRGSVENASGTVRATSLADQNLTSVLSPVASSWTWAVASGYSVIQTAYKVTPSVTPVTWIGA